MKENSRSGRGPVRCARHWLLLLTHAEQLSVHRADCGGVPGRPAFCSLLNNVTSALGKGYLPSIIQPCWLLVWITCCLLGFWKKALAGLWNRFFHFCSRQNPLVGETKWVKITVQENSNILRPFLSQDISGQAGPWGIHLWLWKNSPE